MLCRPFWDSNVDRLDCLCCAVIMLHVVATMYYNNLDFIDSNDLATSNSIPESFEAALIVV